MPILTAVTNLAAVTHGSGISVNFPFTVPPTAGYTRVVLERATIGQRTASPVGNLVLGTVKVSIAGTPIEQDANGWLIPPVSLDTPTAQEIDLDIRVRNVDGSDDSLGTAYSLSVSINIGNTSV
jgi:hypothetical protein